MACGRAGNLGESGNLSGRQQHSAAEAEEEPPTTFSCENPQDAEGGQLKAKKGREFEGGERAALRVYNGRVLRPTRKKLLPFRTSCLLGPGMQTTG